MFKRFRDRRINESVRLQYQENFIYKKDFILPLFLVDGENRIEPVESMPGVSRYSKDMLINYIHSIINKGLKSVLLFWVPDNKGIDQALESDNTLCRVIKALKSEFPSLEIITDVCLCSFTNDGHCHIGDNDKTCEILAEIALNHARAGAGFVAPSDMMDGRVFYIRNILDKNRLNTGIISYSAKFASSYYGPFREAADCTPSSGNRRDYQMNPANGGEAMEEISADIEEGACGVIIKPALSYLDIVAGARKITDKEIICYNVSGEYAALNLLIQNGLADKAVILESLISMKRAGANRIISYFTPYLLEELSE